MCSCRQRCVFIRNWHNFDYRWLRIFISKRSKNRYKHLQTCIYFASILFYSFCWKKLKIARYTSVFSPVIERTSTRVTFFQHFDCFTARKFLVRTLWKMHSELCILLISKWNLHYEFNKLRKFLFHWRAVFDVFRKTISMNWKQIASFS